MHGEKALTPKLNDQMERSKRRTVGLRNIDTLLKGLDTSNELVRLKMHGRRHVFTSALL
jgi:hypothetical protein